MNYQFGLLIFILGLFLFIVKRCLRYLRYLQQEDYDVFRFFHWIGDNKAVDTRGSLLCFLSLIPVVEYSSQLLILQGMLFAFIALIEPDPRIGGWKSPRRGGKVCAGESKEALAKRSS